MAKTNFVKSSGSMLPWLGLALLLLIADQFTKVLILGYYQLGDATYVTSFFNVVRVHNAGAAFSFLASASADDISASSCPTWRPMNIHRGRNSRTQTFDFN